MKHLPTVLMLILASTNASKYYRPNHRQFEQDSPSRNEYRGDEVFVVGGSPFGSEEERFLLPKFSPSDEWEFPPDPRMMLQADLKSFENLLSQNEAEEDRMKRMKTSLSIDNPLDVLRQQYYRALARRMKFKSIEKNREHLIKTGKRSTKATDYQVNFDNSQPDFVSKSSEPKRIGRFVENGSEDMQRFASTLDSNGQNPTTTTYGNRFDEISYQT